MCHYITATLPKGADLDELVTVFDQFKLGFEVIHNPHLESQFPAGEHYILTTRNQCDCGTALGSLHSNADGRLPTYERDLQKFRKQGWSEAKIKRWVQEKELARENAEIKSQTVTGYEISQVAYWVDFLTTALKLGHTSRIGLLLHWYKGSLTNERIKLKNIVTTSVSEITPDYLLQIEEDTLYSFVRK